MPNTLRKFPLKDSEEYNQIKSWLANGEYEEAIQFLINVCGFKNRHNAVSSISDHMGVKFGELPLKPHRMGGCAGGGLTDIEQRVLDIVRKGAASVGEISRQVSIPQEPSKEFQPTEFKYFKKFYRIGLVADTQMCSKYQQVTLLHDAYADFKQRMVDFILHAGDLVDGKNMYRGQANEVFKQGSDEQADYVIQNYPKIERGPKTYVIGGQHDRSFYRDGGYNIIRAICKERKDLVDRGFYKAEFVIKGLKIGLQHPGGGVAYARSYRMQKIIENMMGFMHSIPTAEAPILQIFGHWHIPCHLPSYMGIDAVSLPCFQSQTPYLEQKGLMPVVGYAIAEIQLDGNNNLTSTKIEFIIQNAKIIKNDY